MVPGGCIRTASTDATSHATPSLIASPPITNKPCPLEHTAKARSTRSRCRPSVDHPVRDLAPHVESLPGIAVCTMALISHPWRDPHTGRDPNNSPSMRCAIALGRGGPRHGAGRPRGIRPRVMHRQRERIVARVPVHVTIRLRRGIPSLRQPRFVRRFRSSLSEACVRHGFRVVHYSIQRDHVHLLDRSARQPLDRLWDEERRCAHRQAREPALPAQRHKCSTVAITCGRYARRSKSIVHYVTCCSITDTTPRSGVDPSIRSITSSTTRFSEFRPLVRRLAHRHRSTEPEGHPRSRSCT